MEQGIKGLSTNSWHLRWTMDALCHLSSNSPCIDSSLPCWTSTWPSIPHWIEHQKHCFASSICSAWGCERHCDSETSHSKVLCGWTSWCTVSKVSVWFLRSDQGARNPKFTQPLRVVAQKGLATYKLSDGKVWNAVHPSPAGFLSPEVHTTSTCVQPEDVYNAPQTPQLA